METYMKISQIAQGAGVGVETVRFYERKKLIEQPLKPANGGFRAYPGEVVNQIRFIRRAQNLGFSLKEIKDLMSLRIDPRADCGDVRLRAQAKRQEVIEKIEQLQRVRDALDTVINACPGSGSTRSCSILGELEKGQIS